MKRVTITLQGSPSHPRVIVAPDPAEPPDPAEKEDPPIKVQRGDSLSFEVVGADRFPKFKCAEVHIPGNRERKLMRRSGKRADSIYIDEITPGTLTIGPQAAQNEEHPLKVYAHFSGSLNTEEGKTSSGQDPKMIVF
jgi:hypothetical protein